MQFSRNISELARKTIEDLTIKGNTVATAESCTGGLISGALTSISGSSNVLYGGFVTYANAAKSDMIGVSPATLEAHGAVSDQTVREMAEGALKTAPVDYAIAVTGIAGPGGGSETKPVGLVFFAVATPSRTISRKWNFGDVGRDEVREMSVLTGLELLWNVIQERE